MNRKQKANSFHHHLCRRRRHGNKFDSVQAFYKEFKAAKREYLDYKAACAEWEKAYGEKVTNPMSIIDRLRQKDKGAR